MKQLKFIFASMAIVAVVGSSLAFKAAKFSGFFIYQKAQPSSTSCPRINTKVFDQDGSGAVFSNVYTTTINTATTDPALCTLTVTAVAE